MANYCDYIMKVIGDKDNVKEFIKIITDEYYDGTKYIGPHMYRIFEANVDDIEQYGLQSTVYIGGYCAWSVYCCMMDGEYSYYNDHILFTAGAGNDKYGTYLINESKRLHLFIEIASSEPGMGFGEYYRMNNGIMFEDTTKPYASIYPCCYDTLEECNDDIKSVNEEFDAEIPLLTKKQFVQYNNTGENYAEINECMEMFSSTYYKDMCTSEMCNLVKKENK